MTTPHTPENHAEGGLKEKVYAILDKMYADKSYIDCAYEDLIATIKSEKEKLVRSILNIEGQYDVAHLDEPDISMAVKISDILTIAKSNGLEIT